MCLAPSPSASTARTNSSAECAAKARSNGSTTVATMAAVAFRPVSLGLVVFVAAFALFVVAAAPGLYLRDAGELSTAAFTLGVAHETGFALWCLLGKAATLVPLGEVATRVTLLSAL